MVLRLGLVGSLFGDDAVELAFAAQSNL